MFCATSQLKKKMKKENNDATSSHQDQLLFDFMPTQEYVPFLVYVIVKSLLIATGISLMRV